MLLNIHLKSLRNNEFIQFHQNILQIVLEKDPVSLKVEAPYNDLKDSVDLMDNKHKADRSSALTAELASIDGLRDKDIRGIVANLHSYKYHYNEVMSNASACLLKVVERYEGDIAKYSYQYQTNAIDDIITKWRDDEECVAALNTLHMTDWANKMDEDNRLFNTKFMARVQESAEYSDVKIVELRKEIEGKYERLIQLIQAYATINATEGYTQTVDLINALISEYERTITIRASKRASGEEAEAEETENDGLA